MIQLTDGVNHYRLLLHKSSVLHKTHLPQTLLVREELPPENAPKLAEIIPNFWLEISDLLQRYSTLAIVEDITNQYSK